MTPSNAIFLIGFVAYVTIRAVFEKRSRGIEKVVRRRDGRERALIAAVGTGSTVLPVLYLSTPLLGFADYRLPPLALWYATPVMAAALWLFWRSHADLAENWSVTLELRNGHRLVEHGVYRYMRHPMYAAFWLWGIAQGLLLQNWLAGWSGLVAFALLYFLRARREEAMLRDFFGDTYSNYAKRTWPLFPRLLSRRG